MCRKSGIPEQFIVHHGSLSREVREFAESEMRGTRPLTTVCSSTLELGIDIGNVVSVGQLGPTWSVNSQVQRLGRSGRGEGEAQQMRIYVVEDEIDEKTPLVDQFNTKLLQAIATTELMLKKWVEPPNVAQLDFSTLTQQILSVIKETGGINASLLFEQTVSRGAFRHVNKQQFIGLIRSLAEHELIEQMDQGDLILGVKGESIVEHYTFYSAFFSSVEYAVVFGSEQIGTLPAKNLPQPSDHFLLAGRRWQVLQIDEEHRQIIVKRSSGRKATKFLGQGGEIHPRIREEMRKALVTDKPYSYLSSGAVDLLSDARTVARRIELASDSWVALSPDECLWFTWTGTKIQRTLSLIFARSKIETKEHDIAIQFPMGTAEAKNCVRKLITQNQDARILAELFRAKHLKKFDEYVAVDLLNDAIASDFLDVEGAASVFNKFAF